MNSKSLCFGFTGLLATVALLVLCLGCAVVLPYSIVAMATIRSFFLSEGLALDSATEDPMPVVEQVGESLGYRLTMRGNYGGCDMLAFEKKTPFLVDFITLYSRDVHVTVTFLMPQRKLNLSVMVMGNLGRGSERDAQRALQAFKDKLQESLRAQR